MYKEQFYIGLTTNDGKELNKEEAKNKILKVLNFEALTITEGVGVYTYYDGRKEEEKSFIIEHLTEELEDLEQLKGRINKLKEELKQEAILYTYTKINTILF